jgi:hypothetical protein
METPFPFVAGNGAASAALDISGLVNRTVLIATTGPIYLRFGSTPVTDADFTAYYPTGTHGPLRIPSTVTEMTAWGDGGAWSFCLTAIL